MINKFFILIVILILLIRSIVQFLKLIKDEELVRPRLKLFTFIETDINIIII